MVRGKWEWPAGQGERGQTDHVGWSGGVKREGLDVDWNSSSIDPSVKLAS